MLSIPPPADGRELHEGVPVVDFDADVDDMVIFLNFFYQPVYSNNALANEDTDIAFKLFGVLKLADMLLVEPVKDMILSRIKQDWPKNPSLTEWTARREGYAKKRVPFDNDTLVA